MIKVTEEQMYKNELADLYRSTPKCICYSDIGFELSSGIRSNYYIDSKQVTLSCRGLQLIAACLLYKLQQSGEKIQAIGGMTLGADPIVSACVALSGLNGFIIRKDAKKHGTKSRIEGPLEKSHNVVLVEDVTTTGATVLEAIQVLQEEMGICPRAVFTVVDRGYGAREKLNATGIALHSILTAKDLGVEKAEVEHG